MGELKGKKLLILGGTLISCEIVKFAKQLGVHTMVADYNDISNSPAKQIADESFLVSATDIDAVVDLIKKEKIDGVLVGFNDMLLPYYAQICEKAGLPCYGNKEQFELFINKEKYKQLCREYGVPTVKEYVIDLNNLELEAGLIEYPVLVKPVDSSGSRGISICYNEEELKIAYKKALTYSKNAKVLVEQYLTGKEVTVFMVFQDGKYYLSGIGNRHMKPSDNGILPLPVGYTFPSIYTRDYIEKVFPNVKKMLKAVGIRNGMMFMQCKIEQGTVVVYDIGFRLTGSLEYRIFEMLSGYNPMSFMINFALTGHMADLDISSKIDPYKGYGFNVSIIAEPGIISEIKGTECIEDLQQVSGAIIAHQVGEEITGDMYGLLSQITVRVLGATNSFEELVNTIDLIRNKIKVENPDGTSLIRRSLYRNDFEDYVLHN